LEKERMSDAITVLILDDDDSFRQRTRTWLETAGGIVVVGEAKDEQGAIALVGEARPDVILLDIGAPHTSNLRAVGRICKLSPRTKIIVLSDDDQEQWVLEAFREGALGQFVKRKVQPAEIVEAIRAVSRGKAILSPGVAGRILDQIVQERRHNVGEAE
jgi:DNA-binding NarL/FixJ family response regulator